MTARRLWLAREALRYIAAREHRPGWIENASSAARDTLAVLESEERVRHYTDHVFGKEEEAREGK